MLSWFRKKDDSGQPSRPDPVGVGRIETTKPEKKSSTTTQSNRPSKGDESSQPQRFGGQ